MFNKIKEFPIYIPTNYLKCYIKDIEQYFIDDNWCKDVPFFQTWPTLFERNEQHWLYLKSKTIEIFTLLKNKKPVKLKAWSYVSFVNKKGSLGNAWHTHFEPNVEKLSSIVYLQFENEEDSTLFKFNEYIIMPIIKENTCYVFDSDITHSPSYWDYQNSKKNRIVLAIDAYF